MKLQHNRNTDFDSLSKIIVAVSILFLLIVAMKADIINEQKEFNTIINYISLNRSAPTSCSQLVADDQTPDAIGYFPGMNVHLYVLPASKFSDCDHIGAMVSYNSSWNHQKIIFRQDRLTLENIMHENMHLVQNVQSKFPENNSREGEAYLYTELFDLLISTLGKVK